MYFISQLGEQDCAFACLKMMLANYQNDKNYLYLPNPSMEEKNYNFQEMIGIAKEYGVTLKGIKVQTPQELFKCDKFPIVVTLNKRGDVRHSVLVLKANTRYVTIFDPASGKRRVNSELFFREWTYKALILGDIEPMKCPKTYGDFVSKKDKIILPVLQLLSGVSLLLGTYFVSESSIFYLPIIFLAVFIIFEVIFRMRLVGAMKRLDDNIFSHKFRVNEKEGYQGVYKSIERYRQISLTITPNFIYSCLISLFVIIILLMNDLINITYVILPIALAVVQVFLYNPYFRNKELEVTDKESEIFDVENDYQFKMKSSEAHNSAYSLAVGRNLYTYVELAVLLLSIILTMMISKTINITYVIFYLCISVFLKTNVSRLLEYSSQSEEYDFVKAKLVNSFDEQNNNS